MRKISLVLVAAMLLSTGNVLAGNSRKSNPPKTLSVQIGELLKKNSFKLEGGDMIAVVRFTLNNEKEIVVLSVDTENEVLEEFVKGRLNYKKVDLTKFRKGRTYLVPIRITAY